MSISDSIKDNVAYGKELLTSSVASASEARRAVLESEENSGLVRAAAQESWQAATIGVLAGAVLGVLADDRKPVRGVVAGGMLGAVFGFSASFAWKTRPVTSAMARAAGKRVGEVRGLHWLSKHPINYG